ncbi:hypothetical protein [Paenibacillus sp. SYP-B3998]|uniref:hypothetical protein n=1 Tax=Paenibacillus sp. SYP-B3998 TaxID=2678564 RepID=UPI001F07DD0E|nr:hypothetical protein [Paenibacillus sp. SYP-B3998]
MLGRRTCIFLSLSTNDRLDSGQLHKAVYPLMVNGLIGLSTQVKSQSPVSINTSNPLAQKKHDLTKPLIFLLMQTWFVAQPFVIT